MRIQSINQINHAFYLKSAQRGECFAAISAGHPHPCWHDHASLFRVIGFDLTRGLVFAKDTGGRQQGAGIVFHQACHLLVCGHLLFCPNRQGHSFVESVRYYFLLLPCRSSGIVGCSLGVSHGGLLFVRLMRNIWKKLLGVEVEAPELEQRILGSRCCQMTELRTVASVTSGETSRRSTQTRDRGRHIDAAGGAILQRAVAPPASWSRHPAKPLPDACQTMRWVEGRVLP